MMYDESSKEMTGKVKWFNQYKGYGFVAVKGIPEDVFLHFSVVDESNIKDLSKDDMISCLIVRSDKGYQITKIQRLVSHNKFPTSKRTKKVPAVMKWFNPAKGFGFAQLDSGEDVFIHGNLLKKLNIQGFEPNQRVKLVIQHTNMGYEAIDILKK